MSGMGRMLIVFGVVLVAAGIVMLLAGRANLPVGRMPGDIVYRGRNTTVYFPIVTSILLSIVLSLVLWAIGKFSR